MLIHQAENETRARARWTVCVSSQVGCARGCVFCETGRLGLVRNLTAAEIVSQYAIAARHLGERPKNVVFMGMGEPLDNLEQVLQAIAVLREPAGFAVPERRITVSTVVYARCFWSGSASITSRAVDAPRFHNTANTCNSKSDGGTILIFFVAIRWT